MLVDDNQSSNSSSSDNSQSSNSVPMRDTTVPHERVQDTEGWITKRT
jgi:hypothetical protein